jgi:predicted Zn-dependent protease with MMP-like domain
LSVAGKRSPVRADEPGGPSLVGGLLSKGDRALRFKEFAQAAREAYEAIPEDFKEGVDGLVVSREAPVHPELPDIYTLGQCLTEDYVSDWGGPETTRSMVVLYWGSFRALADSDPTFDWEGELWETLTHELRHHLESLAREDALEGVDYASDETFKRDEGLEFDPWYFQHGAVVERGVFKVENNYYVEQAWRPADFEAAPHLEITWQGSTYRIPRPEELGDVHFVWVHGVVDAPSTLELVLVGRRSWWEEAKRLAGMYRPVVLESEADSEPLDERPGTDDS